MDYLKEIERIVEEKNKEYGQMEKDIQEFKEKEEELTEKVNKKSKKKLQGILGIADDEKLLERLVKAREELEAEYKQVVSEHSKELEKEVSLLKSRYQSSLRKDIQESDDYKKIIELWDEILELDKKIIEEAQSEAQKTTPYTNELKSKGYIDKKSFPGHEYPEFQSYLPDIKKQLNEKFRWKSY